MIICTCRIMIWVICILVLANSCRDDQAGNRTEIPGTDISIETGKAGSALERREQDSGQAPAGRPDSREFREITSRNVMELMKSSAPLLLDVRTAEEFHGGHLENAVHIPVQQLEQRLGEIEEHRDREIIVYCRSGNRSVFASRLLIQKGFKNVHNLTYGLLGWKRSGFGLVK
ncbi:rhodanese-like domain-containing protein [Fibrobacterota bacterium]